MPRASKLKVLSGLRNASPGLRRGLRVSPEPPPAYRIERVFPHLAFTNPVVFTSAPGTDRWFLAQLEGKIFSFPHDNDCDQLDLLVDLAAEIDNVDKVYGMTFHPGFAQNRYCYICLYGRSGSSRGHSVIAVFASRPPTRPRWMPPAKSWCSVGCLAATTAVA